MNYILPSTTDYTVYTKSGCKFCSLVKDLLKDQQVTIVDCDFYLLSNKEDFLKYIYEMTSVNHRTFPIVFYEGNFIGGYTETKKWFDQQTAFFFDFE